MPDFDISVPHIARIHDYWLGFLAVTHPARHEVDIATKSGRIADQVDGPECDLPYARAGVPVLLRTTLVDPGVVPIQDWQPDSALDLNSAPTPMWGGVGCKS